MIHLKIKSVWQGKVGIHEKYLARAKANKEGISFIKGNSIMEIEYKEDEKLSVEDIPF